MILPMVELERLTEIRRELEQEAGPAWLADCADECFLLFDVCMALNLNGQTGYVMGAPALAFVHEILGDEGNGTEA